MTPLRKRESLQAELSGLKGLLQSSPKDPLATPLMQSRIEELETEIREQGQNPPLAPEAELFFTDGPAIGSLGLEITFASDILDSYQNMVTNHYSAQHYGTLRRSGRRRGEEETKLYLTALPRGSFGLQLSQPHISDFVAAKNVSAAMEDVSGLVEATVESDEAFEARLATFNPRVLKPLTRFIEALHTGAGSCRVVTGFKETKLSAKQIKAAFTRVSAAKTEEEILKLPGVFGGVLTFSWEFDFQPSHGDLIHGPLGEAVTADTAKDWNLKHTNKRAIASINVTTVSTRTGKKKPSYELLELRPLSTPPPRPAPKPTPPES